MRSLLVVLFIGGVAVLASFTASRPTVARGDVVAGFVKKSSALIETATCPDTPIGNRGAVVACDITYKNGPRGELRIWLDREGQIHEIPRKPPPGLAGATAE